MTNPLPPNDCIGAPYAILSIDEIAPQIVSVSASDRYGRTTCSVMPRRTTMAGAIVGALAASTLAQCRAADDRRLAIASFALDSDD